MSAGPTIDTKESLSFTEIASRFVCWVGAEPLSAGILAACAGVLVYFYGFYFIFLGGANSTALWAFYSWNSENDLEHGRLILPICIAILWLARDKIAQATKRPSLAGLPVVIGGVLLFVVAARTVQPRLAMLSFPVILYGAVWYLWGAEVARIFRFPCLFMIFMIPAGFLNAYTVPLQTLTAKVAVKMGSMIGIHALADGAKVIALDNSFRFEVAGGCSGVRSLSAMMMIAALFVHYTQREFWKKVVIFGASLAFAVVGNTFRIFSVMLFARFIDPQKAVTTYHDLSGFIFFPIAVGCMLAFSNALNYDFGRLRKRWDEKIAETRGQRSAARPAGAGPLPKPLVQEKSASSYDY